MRPSKIALVAAAAAATLLLAAPPLAHAVDGFAGMSWGMKPDEVRSMFGDRVVHDPKAKNAPKGTSGGALIIRGAKFFETTVDVSTFYSASGLELIRLTYHRERRQNEEDLIAFYEPRWGPPLKTVERDRGRRKLTYAWPWEGVEFRSVENDGTIEYQRLDYSNRVIEDWRRADALVCSMLPTGSSCPFPDSYCPHQDASRPRGRKVQDVDVLKSKGEASCTYDDYKLGDARLTFERPSERAAKWLGILMRRRLGDGAEKRKSTSSHVRLTTKWEELGVTFTLIRRATAKKKDGTWTGPIDEIRLKRSYGGD